MEWLGIYVCTYLYTRLYREVPGPDIFSSIPILNAPFVRAFVGSRFRMSSVLL